MRLSFLIHLIWVTVVALSLYSRFRQFRGKGLSLSETLRQSGANVPVQRVDPHSPLTPDQLKQTKGMIFLFGLIGGGILLASAWSLTSTVGFVKKATRARGEIVEVVAVRGSKGGYSYAPRVRFQTSSGETIHFRTRVSTSRSFWPAAGSIVQVLYQPSPPYRARLDCFADLWMLPMFLLVFGGLFFGFAIFAARSLRKRTDLPPPAAPPSTDLPHSSPGASGYEIPTIIH